MQAPASPLPLGPITRDAEFYPEPFRIQQLKVLLHLAEFTQLCLVLDGPRGVGKSTLLSRFIVEIPENWRVCQMTANAAVSIADLRSALLGTCSIDGDTHGDEELLQHHLAGIRESDLVALLIVDDAETLNNDALRQILTWALPTEGGLHVLLCGTGVYTRLRNPLFSETAATNLKLIELPAFTEEQTAEYAMHRLAAAGQDAASALDDTRLRRVFRASHGLPGHINRELGMLVAPSEQPPTQRLVIFGAS
ncbi:MAG: ATP-binding protein, partial [Gammaproteobacteria bacterium]|nr:ATP-binding protein [Gammaproteobacteria bacterium]